VYSRFLPQSFKAGAHRTLSSGHGRDVFDAVDVLRRFLHTYRAVWSFRSGSHFSITSSTSEGCCAGQVIAAEVVPSIRFGLIGGQSKCPHGKAVAHAFGHGIDSALTPAKSCERIYRSGHSRTVHYRQCILLISTQERAYFCRKASPPHLIPPARVCLDDTAAISLPWSLKHFFQRLFVVEGQEDKLSFH